jgi:hypothetical protein
MPIMVRDNKKAFTPAPEGLHQAVCVDVVDLGLAEGPWGAKPTVELRWELLARGPRERAGSRCARASTGRSN